ncbi:MAG: TonB-dependent receptor, plug [Pedosphaera sp.]|nr:TonB-dependent receptor, plug [Pedosphaera sp.]
MGTALKSSLWKKWAGLAGVLCLTVNYAVADDSKAASVQDATDLTLDQLVNIRVTSVSKKETLLEQSPAAISVITQEDIRRSGLTSIPELLRMVPGMDVAQINASEWAVSARGFNGQFANKLQVLVDGRSIYNPIFAGVRWHVQDLVLEDLDRIEVIRGPGATLWGANSVNGVINIITKSAEETQGLLVSSSYGTAEQPSSSIRYGGELATNLFYRVYAKYVNHDEFEDSMGNETPDAWNAFRGGMRLDWEATIADRFTIQGDYYRGNFDQPTQLPTLTPPFSTNITADNGETGGNVLARWTHEFSESSEITIQAYYDRMAGADADAKEVVDVYDFDLQHRFSWGGRQGIVWGMGYRYYPTYNSPSSFLNWNRQNRNDQLFSAFVQDDLTLIENRLHLTFGSKIEHNDYTGFEYQPSGRLLWTPSQKQTVWGAVSRAVRTPSQLDRDSQYNATVFQPSPASPPVLVKIFGNPNFQSEKIMSYELGYRVEPIPKLSFDLAAFYTVYDSLESIQPSGAPFFVVAPMPHLVVPESFGNGLSGETYGAELSAQWRVTEYWKLAGSYSLLHMHLRPDPSSVGDSPQQQFQVHSYLDLPLHLELNGAAYFVDQINPQSGTGRVQISSYVRLDAGVVWHPSKSLEIGIWGQNLLSDHHAEFASSRTTLLTEVPRSVYGKITWRF